MMDKKALIETMARESFEKGGFNGAWLYAENGAVVSKGTAGFRDPEGTQPVTEDTIFQLASVSKQFTAAAVMLAVRKGLFGLEDEITQFFPELGAYKGVTVRHLLTHTGGVPDYFDDADWFIDLWKKEDRVPGNDEVPRFLCETKLKPEFGPGEKFSYSNTGYNLLALLVERRTGVPYEEFLQRNIFDPAGMTSTRCCHIRRDGIPFENFARATVLEDDGTPAADVDSEDSRDVIAFDGVNGDDYVYTNLSDLLTWDRVLREGKVLTPEEQQLMYTPVQLPGGEPYDDGDGEGYGFGWSVIRDPSFGLIVCHSGGMPGVHTWFERFIDADRMLAILCNREEEDARAHAGFYDGLREIARDREPKPIVTIEEIALKDPDKSKWESFCGKYEHPEDADFVIDEVWLADGELYARAFDDDGDELKFRLYPIGEDQFGRKAGMVKLTFGDGCVTYIDTTCRKLAEQAADREPAE
ncbi:MAG: beta-lactamase family protein [Lachnospiraceae bacterium]|nr:beta-lactamase family protein [Lachnospiraceae bacterium]